MDSQHNSHLNLQRGTAKFGFRMSWWQKGFCYSAPNGPIDLKFCMWGSFGRYIWFLFWLRSFNLYRGRTCSGLQMRLASIEVTWPWLDQKSIVTHKSPLHAKFQVIWSIGAWVTGTTLSENLDFALPLSKIDISSHLNLKFQFRIHIG